MKLYEEFKEYENLWEDTKLTEARRLSTRAEMGVRNFLEKKLGWEVLDYEEEHDHSLSIHYDISKSTVDVNDPDKIDALREFAEAYGVSFSVMRNAWGNKNYIKVYLSRVLCL